MENAEEEMNERMMFLLDADPEDIPAEPDWSLSLPLENSSDLQLFNNVEQKLDHEGSEDEYVDVEGGFTSSNEHNISEPIKHTELLSNADLLQSESCSTAKSTGSTVIMCAKCVEKFENLEDCFKHMRETHDWTGTFNQELDKNAQHSLLLNKPSISHLSYRKKIQVPLLKIRPRKAVALDVIAKRVDAQLSNEVISEEPKQVNVVIKKDFPVSTNKTSRDFLSCSKCQLKFSTKEFLDKHFACHAKNKFGFTCLECKSFFRKWSSCMAHLWKTHQIEVQLYTCEICQSKFLKSFYLTSHMRLHNNVASHSCGICQKSFKTASQLRIHKETHLPKEERTSSRECKLCHRLYSDFRSLKQHMRSMHSEEKSFACTFCDFKTNRKFVLQTHLRSHTGEKPFTCEVCDNSFADHNTLRRHKMKHFGDRKYKCPCCSATFIQSNGYMEHILSKHPDRSDIIMKCHLCSFKTVNKEAFIGHVQRHKNYKEVEKIQPEVVPSSSKAVVSDLKPPSVSFEDLIFENFEPVHKEMPILCESSNNALDFGATESAFDAQITQPPSPSILDELVQAVYGSLS